jgi:saccharopine dehydrogenase-like NADP-dependent oxidoreductase
MTEILLLGGGRIGEAIAALLTSSGDYRVTLADNNPDILSQFAKSGNIETLVLDFADQAALEVAMAGKFAVLSAAPYQFNQTIALAAKAAGVHFLDLTEDVASTRHVKALAEGSKSAFIPQCGLAPGFISIIAHHLTKGFDELHDVRLRVGALPQFPTNALKYNLTWSTEGLINEYIKPCDAIVEGVVREMPALGGREEFLLDGVAYEAFNTSGGIGTLGETLKGKVRNLNYRTVRYPGHRDLVRLLIRDLRLGQRPDLLKEIFELALPMTYQDMVVVFATVIGKKGERIDQESYARRIHARKIDGRHWTAIQITTASGICAVLDLLREGKVRDHGLVRQEEIDFNDFIANRFGANYAFPGDR